jgi:hypothetical protein
MFQVEDEQMSNAHQMAVVTKEAAISNASYYLDVKKFKVLDVADVDEDDDGTAYYADANSVRPLRISAQTGSVSVYDISDGISHQAGRKVTPRRTRAEYRRHKNESIDPLQTFVQ